MVVEPVAGQEYVFDYKYWWRWK